MGFEDKIFKKYTPDFEKLKKFGFKDNNGIFSIEKLFKNGLFKAVITVNSNGDADGIVYDIENNDEFLPLKVKNNQGSFVGEVRKEYEKLLKNIRDNCFSKNYFIYSQSNRITNLIIEKYGDKPEFLWEKFGNSGVFRNSKTKKWYLAILDVDRSKIQENKKGLIETALVKLNPDKVQEFIKKEHYYKAYHMNKKHWITIILDDSVSDKKIMELIDESYNFSCKK